MDRSGYAVVAAIGAVLTLGLGLWHAGSEHATGLDSLVATVVSGALGQRPGVLGVLVLATEPYVLLPVLAATTAVCAWRRRWLGTVLVPAGPALAVALTSWVLKPLFDRHLDGHLAYPSGHTVALVSTMTVLALASRQRRLLWVVGSLSAVVLAGVAVGMVGLRYHYLTDVLGGAFLGVSVVLTVAIALGTCAARTRVRSRNRLGADPT